MEIEKKTSTPLGLPYSFNTNLLVKIKCKKTKNDKSLI